LLLEAEGEASAILARATAQAEAIRTISAALNNEAAIEAAKFDLAKQYIEMYGTMGKQSNTMIFSDRPADINALLAQASAVVRSLDAKK